MTTDQVSQEHDSSLRRVAAAFCVFVLGVATLVIGTRVEAGWAVLGGFALALGGFVGVAQLTYVHFSPRPAPAPGEAKGFHLIRWRDMSTTRRVIIVGGLLGTIALTIAGTVRWTAAARSTVIVAAFLLYAEVRGRLRREA